MNYEIISYSVLVFSLVGIIFFIYRKIPVLVSLPDVSSEKDSGKPSFFRKAFEKINPLKDFSSELFLQKILSTIRVLSLKTDHKTFNWLQNLRQNSQKNKLKDNEKYWDEIKKSTK